MYKYVEEAEAQPYRNVCSDVLKKACIILKEKGISTQAMLIGSGGRNMITRNGKGPFDLDYNLVIQKADEKYWNDLRLMKDTVRNALNKANKANGFDFSDAQDSTSVLTCLMHFKDEPQVKFSFDVAIVKEDEHGWHRLIHPKNSKQTNNSDWNVVTTLGVRPINVIGYNNAVDSYCWNQVKHSEQLREKADAIKKADQWLAVRDRYLELKNLYLRQQEDKASFVVYVEAVNEIYKTL